MKFLSHPFVRLLSSLFQVLYGLKLLGVILIASGGPTSDSQKLFGGILIFSAMVGLIFRKKLDPIVKTAINLSDEQLTEVKGLLKIGLTIEAIKKIREFSGCDLSEAKNFIMTLEK